MDKDVWSFRLGGKIQAYQTVGIGSAYQPRDGQAKTTLHTPPRTTGRIPFGAGSQLTLSASYGTAVVGGFVNYTVNSVGKEYAGYYAMSNGASANSAYIGVTPQALGNFRLQVKVGAFTESYAGTGQWGWGVLGPLLAVRGYGEVLAGEYDLTPDLRLFLSHGVFAVPGVPEFFVRGTFAGWNETGVSTVLQHAHVGLSYQGKYVIKLHAANAAGTDERTYLADADFRAYVWQEDCSAKPSRDEQATCNSVPRDGRMDILALETHTFLNQWGQFGLSAAYYNLVSALAVRDGVWWTVDWTQGSNETRMKYLGPRSNGTGSLFAVSAQYDFSLASVLWHPQGFDGRGADLRAAVAGIYHQTLKTEDDDYDDARGFQVGADVEYRMLPWLSATLRSYGTYRNISYRANQSNTVGQASIVAGGGLGKHFDFSVTPGLIFRSDWQAAERIEIAYSRYFYSDFVDAIPEDPRDKHVLTVGASLSF